MAGMRTGDADSNELAVLVAPLWSEAKALEALGIDASALAARRAEGTILRLTTSDGMPVYPVAQFHRHDGTVEVNPALLPLLQALRGFDAWTVAVLLHTPAPELDDQTPLDWVRHDGSSGALTDLAHAVASEWSAGSIST